MAPLARHHHHHRVKRILLLLLLPPRPIVILAACYRKTTCTKKIASTCRCSILPDTVGWPGVGSRMSPHPTRYVRSTTMRYGGGRYSLFSHALKSLFFPPLFYCVPVYRGIEGSRRHGEHHPPVEYPTSAAATKLFHHRDVTVSIMRQDVVVLTIIVATVRIVAVRGKAIASTMMKAVQRRPGLIHPLRPSNHFIPERIIDPHSKRSSIIIVMITTLMALYWMTICC